MNTGCSSSEKTQNAFTAYLLIALKRNVFAFVRKQNNTQYETPLDDNIEDKDFTDENLVSELSIIDQIECKKLAKLLSNLSRENREILYMKVFEELSLPQIAAQLDLHIQKVSAIYYRVIKSLKNSLGDE